MNPGAVASLSMSPAAVNQNSAARSSSTNVACRMSTAPAASGPRWPSGPCWVPSTVGAMRTPSMAVILAIASIGGGVVSSSTIALLL